MKYKAKLIADEILSRHFWERIIIMVISMFFLAINYNTFLLHNKLVIGGTSGLATIFNSYLNISPSTFILIFNMAIILISYFALGPKLTGQALIGSLIYPFFVSITSGWCEVLAQKIILEDFILIVIVSGLIFGVANGFIYKTGFSTGGVDTMIRILSKFTKTQSGTISFIVNVIIIIAGAIMFGPSKAVYAIIVVFFNSMLVDKISLGISDSKMFIINTSKIEEVKQFILTLNTGYTILKIEGGYSPAANNLIMCVISTKDYYVLKSVVKQLDPKAFFTISDCYQVYGGHRKERFPFI